MFKTLLPPGHRATWQWLLVPLLMLLGITSVQAQVPITTSTLSYTQDFNGLSNVTTTTQSWSDNTTIPGWLSTATTYSANAGTSNTGSLYSYGAANATDRALGSAASGSAQPQYGVVFVNNTGSAISSLQISYTGEQWRNGGNTTPQSLTFSFATGSALTLASSTSIVPALNFTGPIATATAAALDGNASANRTAITATITFAIPVANGQQVLLKWTDLNDLGNDHGLAIDDLTVMAALVAPAAPVITNNAAQLTACVGSPMTLSATCATGAVVWNAGTTASTFTIASVLAGATSYSATCLSGAVLSSLTTTTVTGVALPSALLANNGPISCAQLSATLTATPAGAAAYAFGSGATQVGGSTGNTATVTTAGLYSVVVTSTEGCTASAQTTVTGSTTAPTASLVA